MLLSSLGSVKNGTVREGFEEYKVQVSCFSNPYLKGCHAKIISRETIRICQCQSRLRGVHVTGAPPTPLVGSVLAKLITDLVTYSLLTDCQSYSLFSYETRRNIINACKMTSQIISPPLSITEFCMSSSFNVSHPAV